MLRNKEDIKLKLINDFGHYKADDVALEILKLKIEKELLACALDKDQRLSNRAMWILCHCNDFEPNKIKPFYPQLIQALDRNDLHTGVIRSIVRIFAMQDAPEKYQSVLIDKCYKYLNDYKMPIAVRAFAISAIFKISNHYPELLNELEATLLKIDVTQESPGMKAKIKNTIKDITNAKSKTTV